MELNVNHQSKNYSNPPKTLEELINLELNSKTKGIAVAINNCIIPRKSWPETPLQESDSILIITASQGG